MAENIQAGIDALVMDERDHVATALRELSKGTDITCRLKEDLFRVKLLDNIEFGHKLAIRDIAKRDADSKIRRSYREGHAGHRHGTACPRP